MITIWCYTCTVDTLSDCYDFLLWQLFQGLMKLVNLARWLCTNNLSESDFLLKLEKVPRCQKFWRKNSPSVFWGAKPKQHPIAGTTPAKKEDNGKPTMKSKMYLLWKIGNFPACHVSFPGCKKARLNTLEEVQGGFSSSFWSTKLRPFKEKQTCHGAPRLKPPWLKTKKKPGSKPPKGNFCHIWMVSHIQCVYKYICMYLQYIDNMHVKRMICFYKCSCINLQVFQSHQNTLLSQPKTTTQKIKAVDFILLMEEILHQLIITLSHYLQGNVPPRYCRISEPSTVGHVEKTLCCLEDHPN